MFITTSDFTIGDAQLAEGVTRELGGRADNGLRPYTSPIKVAFMGGFTG